MSFLTGQTKELSPKDVQGFRKMIEGYIGQQGLGSTMTETTDLSPFTKMFAQNRAQALAQAKEQAGTLTGSGFANVMGSAAGRSVYDENAFLAQLMSQERQANASRFMQLLGLPAAYTGQMGYEPGFLDYLFQGAESYGKAAAGAKAMG